MERVLVLAQKGRYTVRSNPMVGAILLKNGKIIGQGYHEKYGENHAEVNAIAKAKENPKNATLYVNLEPCCHTGKTPPCTDLIIKCGIKKVVIASQDPNPKVNGKGIERLKKAGIKVEVGVLDKENQKLNEKFFTFYKKNRPFIALKAAVTVDFKISISNKIRTAISSKTIKKNVLDLRDEHEAILVGSGTVLTDNPHLLGSRKKNRINPLRIIMGNKHKLKNDLNIFNNNNHLIYEGKNLHTLMRKLYEMKIGSILVEGGNKIFSSFIKAKLVDKIYLIMSQKIMGKECLDFINLSNDLSIEIESVEKLGHDLIITSKPKWDL